MLTLERQDISEAKTPEEQGCEEETLIPQVLGSTSKN